MRFLAVLLLMPLLTACNYTVNQNSIIARDVQSVPLANGTTLDVGYKLPDSVAACELINETSRNWAVAESEGELKYGGGRQVLLEAAVASVNQRPQDGINYVALTIPNEADIISIDVTAGRDATTSYFRCVAPPQPQ
jgi:hypothetical protein